METEQETDLGEASNETAQVEENSDAVRILSKLAADLNGITPQGITASVDLQGFNLSPISKAHVSDERNEGSIDDLATVSQWQKVQGKRNVTHSRAAAGDHIPTSPSRFQILENIPEAEDKEDGEITQEEGLVIGDKQTMDSISQIATGEDLKQRNLRPRVLAKPVDSSEKSRKGKDLKEDKKIFGNGKNTKASARKH